MPSEGFRPCRGLVRVWRNLDRSGGHHGTPPIAALPAEPKVRTLQQVAQLWLAQHPGAAVVQLFDTPDLFGWYAVGLESAFARLRRVSSSVGKTMIESLLVDHASRAARSPGLDHRPNSPP